MKPIETLETLTSSETVKNFNLKSFILGIFLGIFFIGSLTYTYVSENYVKVYTVDIGHFAMKDGHIYQLEKLVDPNYVSEKKTNK